METGQVIEADWFEYNGPLVQATGGPSSSGSSKPTYMIPSLLPDIAAGARTTITGPASGKPMTIGGPGTGISAYQVPQTLTDLQMNQAVNQIRGGYGARGLAGSGIAASGEQQAVGQLALQGAQQQATNLTNLLAAGSGQTSQQSSGGGGMFGTVVCTELNRQGLMSDALYEADCEFARTLPVEVITGYHVWAVPLVHWMQQSKTVTWLASLLAIPWAKEMAYRIGRRSKGSIVGKVVLFVGVPVCRMISLLRTPNLINE